MTTETNNNAAQILFFYNGIKATKGAKIERAFYTGHASFVEIRSCVTIGFSEALRNAVPVERRACITPPGFGNDFIVLTPEHPLFANAYAALCAQEARHAKRFYAKAAAYHAARRAEMN